MKLKAFLICSGLLLLLGFYFFSREVKNERFTKINFDTTVKLQDNIPSKLDEPLEDMSFFVSPMMSLFWLAILTIIASVDIKQRKFYPGAFLIPLFFALMIGAEIYGKVKVESQAPPFFMLKNPTTIFPKYHVQEAYSYPSGHAARAMFLVGVASFLALKRWNLFIFCVVGLTGFGIVLLMSLGKIYLGHHWLSDIIGGWMISMAFLSFTIFSLLPEISWKRKPASIEIS